MIFTELQFLFIHLSLNFAGGYREVEIPSPIPNLEVKHFIADNTAGSPGGNVGRCQLLSFYFNELSFKHILCLVLSFFFSLLFLLFHSYTLLGLFEAYLSSPPFTYSKVLLLYTLIAFISIFLAHIAPMAEQFHGKEQVIGSTPFVSSILHWFNFITLFYSLWAILHIYVIIF